MELIRIGLGFFDGETIFYSDIGEKAESGRINGGNGKINEK